MYNIGSKVEILQKRLVFNLGKFCTRYFFVVVNTHSKRGTVLVNKKLFLFLEKGQWPFIFLVTEHKSRILVGIGVGSYSLALFKSVSGLYIMVASSRQLRQTNQESLDI